MCKEPSTPRVLVVDDNIDLAESTSMLLRLTGFTTATAYNGHVAVERARSFHPDIVLMDIGLPDMAGYELASTLRKDPGLGHAVMIAISAGSFDLDASHADEARFDHYLIKPIDLDHLLRILSRARP
jgi:CheY-like chemotaxis protein